MLGGKTETGGIFQLRGPIQGCHLKVDIPVQFKIPAAGRYPVFPGIARKLVFKGNGRPAIPRVRFEYNPGVHLFAADSLESKGTLQNLPAGIEATVGPESGFHLVLVHYRNLIVV